MDSIFRRILSNKKLLQSFFAEMLCSFIFGFTVYSAIIQTKYKEQATESVTVSLAIAFCSVVIIYTFCDLTISHFNPAITLAAILTRKLDPFNGIGFIIAQGIGFILAANFIAVTFPGTYQTINGLVRVGSQVDGVTNVNIFFAEFALTAILVFVAFSVCINALRDPAVSLYEDEELPNRTIIAPLIIGLTLGFLSFIAAKTSGSYFNPGLVFAPMILTNNWDFSWQYYCSEFAGGLFGALIQVWILFK